MSDLGVVSSKNHPRVNLSDHYSDRLSDYGSYDTRARRTAENYANFRTWSGQQVTERNIVEDGDDESGFCSPPLWRTSPTASPPHRKNNHYRSLSPASKVQAIARGQKELMEMVSRMPESCYELTLKDLVEQQPVMELKQQSFREEKEVKREKGVKRTEKRMEIMKRNESLSRNNEGLFLKMVFPIRFGAKKKKKNNLMSNNNYSSRVSPKSPIPEGSDDNKAVDKEWWKKRFSVQGETDQSSGESSGSNNGSGKSTVSTNSSCSISRSGSRHESGGGCWSFIRIPKRKNVE